MALLCRKYQVSLRAREPESGAVCRALMRAWSINGVMLSDTLTEWVFKFFGLEMLALSGIKVSKHIGSAFGKLEEAVDGALLDEDEEAKG